MSKRKTKLEWQTESDLIHNNEFEILEEPTSGQQNIDILHKKCGNIISIKLNNHLKRYCKYCSKKSKKEYQNLSDLIHSNEFEILEEPNNVKSKIKILHKKCGNILNMTMNNHINHKNGCKACSKYSLKSNQYWINKCKEIWNNDYIILDEVTNCNNKVRINHTICGRTHLKSMDSFIHGKRGCPYCYNTDLKYAEKYVMNYLDSIGLKYETEKKFKDLVNPETGRKLRFDFWIPSKNLIIEVNGIQHYKAIECWGGEKYFQKQIYRDNIKKNYLINNNINLLIINNKQLTKIKEYL
jgi:hypothetical protein